MCGSYNSKLVIYFISYLDLIHILLITIILFEMVYKFELVFQFDPLFLIRFGYHSFDF
jgi:hypothetical protein